MALIPKNPNEVLYVGGKKHFQDVIKNGGEADALIFREMEEDFNTNSTLIVAPGEQAVFVRDGQIEYVFTESGKYTLTTKNYPFLTRLKTMLTGGISKYSCIIIFVRTTTSKEILWGDNLSLVDPLSGLMTEFGVNGAYRVTVEEPKKLIDSLPMFAKDFWALTGDMLPEYCSRQFLETIKSELGKSLLRSKDDLRNAGVHLAEYSEILFPRIAELLGRFGLKLLSFSVSGLEMHKDENRSLIEGAIASKAELGILGPDWMRVKAVETLRNCSTLSGSAGMMGGIYAGMAAAPLMNRVIHEFSSGFSEAGRPAAPRDSQTACAQEGNTVCRSCGCIAHAGQKFCAQCGAQLHAARICPSCGADADANARFCGNCGKTLDE